MSPGISAGSSLLLSLLTASALFASDKAYVAAFVTASDSIRIVAEEKKYGRLAEYDSVVSALKAIYAPDPKVCEKVRKTFEGKGFSQPENLLIDGFNTMSTEICSLPFGPDGPENSCEDLTDLPGYGAWDDRIQLRGEEVYAKRHEKFKAKYGGGEKLTYWEVFLDNSLIQVFRSGYNDPVPFEPILRFSPINYNVSSQQLFSQVQVGLNYYYLGDYFVSKWYLRKLNPVGLAFAIGNTESEGNVFDIINHRKYGWVFHIATFEIGRMEYRDGHTITLSKNISFIPGWL